MVSAAHGSAPRDCDDHGNPQSQYAALFYSSDLGGTSARYLFGDGLRHGGNDPRRRLIGPLRHPAAVPAIHREAAGGFSITPFQTADSRRRFRTYRSGRDAGYGRSAAYHHL